MNITLATLWQPNYDALAEKVIPNRREYCERHGFRNVEIRFNQQELSTMKENHRKLGFQKLRVLMGCLVGPGHDAVLFLDLDAVITNMAFDFREYLTALKDGSLPTRLAPKKNSGADVFAASDCNGGNPGAMIVFNSSIAYRFIEASLKLETNAPEITPYEGEALAQMDERLGGKLFGILPQRPFNLYDYSLYQHQVKLSPKGDPLDCWGEGGQWADGDFVIQFPGRTLEQRLKHVDEYLLKVRR